MLPAVIDNSGHRTVNHKDGSEKRDKEYVERNTLKREWFVGLLNFVDPIYKGIETQIKPVCL